jgi:hypothetical protein
MEPTTFSIEVEPFKETVPDRLEEALPEGYEEAHPDSSRAMSANATALVETIPMEATALFPIFMSFLSFLSKAFCLCR